MPRVRIDLPQVVYDQLLQVALHEWRPPQWQAEILLKGAIEAAAQQLPTGGRMQETLPIETAPRSRKPSRKTTAEVAEALR